MARYSSLERGKRVVLHLSVRRRRCRWDEVACFACVVADADFAIHEHEGDDGLVSDLDLYLTYIIGYVFDVVSCCVVYITFLSSAVHRSLQVMGRSHLVSFSSACSLALVNTQGLLPANLHRYK